MENIDWVREYADEYGEILRIEGKPYYDFADWERIKEEQARQGFEGGDDVRAAGYVLGQLGIQVRRSYGDQDEHGKWLICWA